MKTWLRNTTLCTLAGAFFYAAAFYAGMITAEVEGKRALEIEGLEISHHLCAQQNQYHGFPLIAKINPVIAGIEFYVEREIEKHSIHCSEIQD